MTTPVRSSPGWLRSPVLDALAARTTSVLAMVRLPARRGTGPSLIVRSTSLGDFTVFLPFLASVVQRDPTVRLLTISRNGNVGASLLPHWAERITMLDPRSRASVQSGVAVARAMARHHDIQRILYTPQNNLLSASTAIRLALIRAIAGTRVPILGMGVHADIRSRAQLERTPDAPALNQALVPFVACGMRPSATRADCDALLATTSVETERAVQIIRTAGGDPDTSAVAMYVHAKDALERFVAIARQLSSGSGRQLWLIGGPEDVDASLRVASALPRGRAVVLAGVADVRSTVALLPRCSLFVGNDGAPTHLAALCGCPCVALFCTFEVPGIWEPVAAPASRSLRPAWTAAREHGDFGIETIGVAAVQSAIADIEANPRGHLIQTMLGDGEPGSPHALDLPFGGPLLHS